MGPNNNSTGSPTPSTPSPSSTGGAAAHDQTRLRSGLTTPRCTVYRGSVRCGRTSAGVLLAPDGGQVPGGHTCRAHADEVIAEYAEKLGEAWTIQPYEVA